MNKTTNESNLQKIKSFLSDIECLDELEPWIHKFNLFDVLKIKTFEIRHSNMLAWLLNPKESHNMKDLVLSGVMERLQVDVFEFDDFKIYRENDFKDLLLVSEKQKFVMCIENKINAKEGDDQLNRYFNDVTNSYPPEYKKVFVYLTPNGDTPSSDEWQILSYVDLLEIIKASKEKNESSSSPDVEVFIRHYIETVRSIIVCEKELVKKCYEIYAKHSEALDLIYEKNSDTSQLISIFLEELCVKKTKANLINFDSTENTRLVSNTFVRFTTPAMTEILPDCLTSVSGWETPNIYFYEIIFKNNTIEIVLNLGIGREASDIQQENCNKLIKIITGNVPNRDWQCKKLKTFEMLKDYPDSSFAMIKGEIEDKFEKAFDELLAFEKETIEKFNQS